MSAYFQECIRLCDELCREISIATSKRTSGVRAVRTTLAACERVYRRWVVQRVEHNWAVSVVTGTVPSAYIDSKDVKILYANQDSGLKGPHRWSEVWRAQIRQYSVFLRVPQFRTTARARANLGGSVGI